MTKQLKLKATRLVLAAMILLLAFGTLSFAQGQRYKSPDAWSFGVHGDTQWTVQGNPEDNPNTVSAALARAVSARLRDQGVKFVIQTGDLTDYAGAASLATRASVAEETLYDFGIGFFPMRGNHETYGYMRGWDPDANLNVPDFKTNFPQTQGQGPNLFGADNFSSPEIDILKGMSYSFDYGTAGNKARFVIVDTEVTAAVPKAAPNNPASCVSAITTYGGAPAGTSCGQGYYYILWDWVEGGYKTNFVVYQTTVDINGYTTYYGPAGNQTGTGPITITAGTWFRIDSSQRPSTNFYAWDIPNPDQLNNGQPFDINYPVADPRNRILVQITSSNTEYFPGKQQGWISAQLDQTTRGTEHAFVFSHRPVINENHTDSFFGANSYTTPDDQNAFFASLQGNGVKFMISGHDHLYNRAVVESPDGLSEIEQIVTQGISTKFYSPVRLDSFGKDGIAPDQTWVKDRETQIAQEVNNFGYYIYTVDGPRVTADYYSDAIGNFKDGQYYPDGDPNADPPILGSLLVPNFAFVKKDSWGYSLNGQQFTIPQGASYTVVQDSFGTTEAKIRGGINASTTTDLTPVGYATDGTQVSGPRPLNKIVNTGWVANPNPEMLKSDILSLWGMSELGEYGKTDTYALALSFKPQQGVHLGNEGGIGTIVSLNSENKWVNAVDLNFGGTKNFVSGPFNEKKHGLGAYGFDPSTRSAWAVVNYNADFAVVNNIVTVPPGQAKSNKGGKK